MRKMLFVIFFCLAGRLAAQEVRIEPLLKAWAADDTSQTRKAEQVNQNHRSQEKCARI
jgi:hypothetical protein